MKIQIVLSHPAPEIYGETREVYLAQRLAGMGHEVGLLRAFDGGATITRDTGEGVAIRYCPADDGRAEAHATVSTAMLHAVLAEKPDILIFKGIGYSIVGQIIEGARHLACRIGFILGGNAVEPELVHADFVLTESDRQAALVRTAVKDAVLCQVLPKYINWPVADRVFQTRLQAAPRYDIVNVGQFEPRKNQIELQAFFADHAVALIGDGETRPQVELSAKDFPKVEFLGSRPNDQVLETIGLSRIMVHCSLWEGVPRSLIESLACGTPVVAYGHAIQGDFDESCGVRLVASGELHAAVTGLLSDPESLGRLSENGRRFARDVHGPDRLTDAAAFIAAAGR
ncbi:glycosyltransferase family 4 protein [Paracraurococcus ruber]|uniref:Glycosyl transferase family 1 domain-containing protein n=1 Tax=Paracraurococcus ruber TaxID=77675 RepID=A0ABS1CWH1_9PROT|nr:glycosyltransferase family 4 protein [Paracraurococcus ruber]MBK1658387.1 hypothetical protein [Paracraurococcus ruber]TDG31056.1 glycosyltransferase [Paracraurococcus ruber]